MKRFKLASLIPLLCLSSCSGSSPYGTYEFRLGKTDGSHVSIMAEVLNEEVPDKGGAQKITLSVDLGKEFSLLTVLEQYEEKMPIIKVLIDALGIREKIGEIKSVEGYYSLSNVEHPKYGRRLNVGSDALTKFVAEALEAYGIAGYDFEITPDITEKIACVYLNNKSLTLQIPVSLPDLITQLAWYGYYIDINLDNFDYSSFSLLDLDFEGMKHLDKDLLPGPKDENRYGIHPVVNEEEGIDEVGVMNSTFRYQFSRTRLFLEGAIIGSFVVEGDEQTGKYVGFEQSEFYEEEIPSVINGYIKVKGLTSTSYDIQQAVTLSIDETGKVNGITHNGKFTKEEEGFIVTTPDGDKEIKYKDFIQEPFVFRDFHDVNIGLSKI